MTDNYSSLTLLFKVEDDGPWLEVWMERAGLIQRKKISKNKDINNIVFNVSLTCEVKNDN